MSASATSPKTPPKQSAPRTSSVVRTKTHKPAHVQSAITLRRANGQSKLQIAKELGIARNTVTSILELNNVEQQIAQYRVDTIAIVPDAIIAVHEQVKSGDGDLGLRLLERAGVIGEDAIDAARRNSQRQRGAINVLVAPGATMTVMASNNNDAVPQVNNDAPQRGVDTDSNNNSTTTSNNKVTVTTAGHPRRQPPGKQPRDGVGR